MAAADQQEDGEEQLPKACSWSSSTTSSTTCSSVIQASPSPAHSLPDEVVDGAAILGRVWELAQDSEGCRQVQQAMEEANQEQQVVLASELRGQILQAIECPHANHVVQKCIIRMPPDGFQFVLDELLAGGPEAIGAAIRHKYGCRIVKCLLEHGRPGQVQPIAEAVLEDAVDAARHHYGTFVVQHMLLHLEEEPRRGLLRRLTESAAVLAPDPSGCAALGAALADSGLEEEVLLLARRLVEETGLLVEMACLRHGRRAVEEVMQLLRGQELKVAQQQLVAGSAQLSASRYGRAVAKQYLAQLPTLISLEGALQMQGSRA